jgi:curved DNA-binding protein CbpA
VHPEADAAMIDAAYWHLAKRWNESAAHDYHARQRMEELNEAYNVLGSADRRDEYMKVRAEVLGTNALPVAPPPAREKPPLAIMVRQRPKPRSPVAAEQVRKLWGLSAISGALAIPFVLALGVAAFLAGSSPDVVAGLLVVGLLVAAAPLASAIPKLHLRLPSIRVRSHRRKPSVHLPRHRARAQVTPIDTGRMRSATKSRAEQLRRHEVAPSPPGDKPAG